ncbi:MAG: hypothetical protein EXR64_00755 [Dehalococcoidia bacterium]|nr:hypothetical protein [Dehalococcoidia bacterium]
MTTDSTFPGGMSESAFLRAYASTALRKPQIVADNVLTGIFLADAAYRPALTALLVQEAIEAARRLNHVWLALVDRTHPVARSLARPLPGAAAWTRFAADVALAEERPAALLEAMHLDGSALQSAEELAEFPGLASFATPMRAFEAGPPTVTTLPGPAGGDGGGAASLLLSNLDADGAPVEARLPLEDDHIIALGDAAGDFATWARDFLGAYIEAREGAGR